MSIEHNLMKLIKHPKGHLVHVTLSDHVHGVRISVSNMCNEILWHVADTAEAAVEYAINNFESALQRYNIERAQRMLNDMREAHAETQDLKAALKSFLRSNNISCSCLDKK